MPELPVEETGKFIVVVFVSRFRGELAGSSMALEFDSIG